MIEMFLGEISQTGNFIVKPMQIWSYAEFNEPINTSTIKYFILIG